MRVRRFLLISGLILAGGVAARPEEVVPLATRLIAPMLAHKAVKPAPEDPDLPGFVPRNSALSMGKPERSQATNSQAVALAPVVNAPAPDAAVAPVQIGRAHV